MDRMTRINLGWVLAVSGVIILMMAFHNIDTAWNMASECWDYNGIIYQDRISIYVRGAQCMVVSLGFFLIAFLIVSTGESDAKM